MYATILRSIAAILVGWLVAVGGYIVTMVVIALFYREAFASGTQFSAGWWVVHLFVGVVCSVAAGYVAGVTARRREIAHAIGLVLFALLVAQCWPRTAAGKETMAIPSWYWIAAYVLTPVATILGGWLRMKQRILLQKGSALAMRATDNVRFVIAILVASATFILVLFVAGILQSVALIAKLFHFRAAVPPQRNMTTSNAASAGDGQWPHRAVDAVLPGPNRPRFATPRV